MPKLQTLILLGILCLSCAHPPKSSPGARIITVAPDAQLVQIEVRRGTETQKLPPDTALPVDADFALSVELASPGYVYLVRSSPRETALRLYPKPGSPAILLDAGSVRIPSAGTWLRLKRFAATDLLCLLLSARPLSTAEQRCEPRQLGGRNDDDPKTPPLPAKRESSAPPPPPPPADPRGPDPESTVKVIRLTVQGAS